MFLEVYLGFLSALLTIACINAIIFKWNQHKHLKQQLQQALNNNNQNRNIILKQHTTLQ